jgi:hypothetical protein
MARMPLRVSSFIMKDDFEGVKVGGQYGFDSSTSTPTFSTDLGGRQFRGRRAMRSSPQLLACGSRASATGPNYLTAKDVTEATGATA